MSTKLEVMVGYLSGRKGDPRLVDELADPSSEASRFLEETRARSRALIDDAPAVSPPARPAVRRWAWRVVAASVAGASILAAGAAIRVGEARLRRLEQDQARGESEARGRAIRLEAALDRLAEPRPPDPALGRIDSALARMVRRLDALEQTAAPVADPMLAEVRDDLASLRRDLASQEKARTRQAEEFQATLHEVARLLRLLINRSDPPPPEPTPRRAP